MILIRRWMMPSIVAISAVYLIHSFCIVPVRCNRQGALIAMRNETAARGLPYQVAPLLRQNIAEAAHCLRSLPADYYLRIELANSYLLMARYDEAAALLKEGLRYDRRPEIFVGLGKAQLASGHREAGIQSLLEAGRFLRNEPQLNDLLQDVGERELINELLREEFARQSPQ